VPVLLGLVMAMVGTLAVYVTVALAVLLPVLSVAVIVMVFEPLARLTEATDQFVVPLTPELVQPAVQLKVTLRPVPP
jgi:hypothetical protein